MSSVSHTVQDGTLCSTYGIEQKVRLRSILAKVRFLKGLTVFAVWSEIFDDDKKSWGKRHLLLAIETNLDAQMIILLVAASPNMLNFSRFENAQSFHPKFIAEAVFTM